MEEGTWSLVAGGDDAMLAPTAKYLAVGAKKKSLNSRIV
jgi:hypothetical protein